MRVIARTCHLDGRHVPILRVLCTFTVLTALTIRSVLHDSCDDTPKRLNLTHQRIYTDANLCNPEIFHIIQNFTHDLMEYIQHENIDMPLEWDLVLELEANALIPGDFHWTYYFVAPSKRLLFWVHPYDLTEELGEILGEVSPTHLRKSILLFGFSCGVPY